MEFTNRKNQAGITGSSTITSGGEEIVQLPPCNLSMGVTVTVNSVAGGGTCTVYTSTSNEDKLLTSAAIWVEWPLGAIVLGSDVLVGPVSGLKFVATSADGNFEVVTA